MDIEQLRSLIRFVGEYEGNGRDPRDTKESWSKSYGFVLVLPNGFSDRVQAFDDASEAGWFDIKSLPVLAFDHGRIITDALNKLDK